MRTLCKAVILWGVGMAALGFLTLTGLSAEASEVLAGVAKQTFQLPEGVPLAGFSRRDGAPARGVHDAVGVRALVVQDAKRTVALVSCDLLIVDERLFAAVQRRLAARSLQEPPTLFLAATHTHSGPGAYGQTFLEKLSMGHFDPQVFETLVHQIVETILHAQSHLEPVRLAYRQGTTQDLVVNRVDPTGGVDAELTVCAFYDAVTDEPLAIVVNFAAHPTTLGAWNLWLSADYPGVVTRALEARWPSATCLFFAAAVGDQAPVKHGEDFAPAHWLGQALAAQAMALLEDVEPTTPQAVFTRAETIPLPPARLRVGAVTLPSWLSRWFVDDDATVSLVVVGEVAFQGVPCDLTAGLGRHLKEAAQTHALKPVIVGFVNDYIGYCIPAALYEAKTYEASLAFNGPHTGELIVQRLTELLDEVAVR